MASKAEQKAESEMAPGQLNNNLALVGREAKSAIRAWNVDRDQSAGLMAMQHERESTQ